MHHSIIEKRGAVPFPAHAGERIYMRAFTLSAGLPPDLRHWQDTVDAMLAGVDVAGPIYLMVDQANVRAGVTHRRPGLHMDGYWDPGLGRHGAHMAASHRGQPPEPRHREQPARHIGNAGGWAGAKFEAPEAIILASNVRASRALAGEFIGAPGEGGDCRHIDTRHMREVLLEAGHAYAGNVSMLHESLPVMADCQRTVVRLNVPGWSP